MVVDAGLTLWIASAYRCSVTRCRPVPHVHEEQPTHRVMSWVGGASRKAILTSGFEHCRPGPVWLP